MSAASGRPSDKKKVSRYSFYIFIHIISSSKLQLFTNFKTNKRSNGPTERWTDNRRTDRRTAKTNMPHNFFDVGGHNYA